MSDILKIVRGDDKTWTLTVTESSAPHDPVDITGCTFIMTIREDWRGTIFLTKSTDPDDGIIITDPLNGIAEITIDAEDTADLTNIKHSYVFDVQVTKVTGKIETLCKGKFIVLPEATEPEELPP